MQQGKRKGAPDNGATREDLAILCSVPGATYAQIGEFYGLSERWAQKWCSRYGLKLTAPRPLPRPSLPSPSRPAVRTWTAAELAEEARRSGVTPRPCPTAFVAPSRHAVRDETHRDVRGLREHARVLNEAIAARAFRHFDFTATPHA
ncbi:hypothetical protein [Azospirillum sp. TSO5]|uniref:hypothetical protein n=1 Tax=Azospirillum sp. TSO5 TaxID=716760 RepID=UPI000D609427|nr:hypothetical protein [Azospirillum sp. TSO5]PWC97724.1 hypothetical protein TSO5_04275 [Azospirillum sp. TSO5]